MIRTGIALAAAALIGCTGLAAAAGGDAKCNEAVFKKRHSQLFKAHSDVLDRKLAYKGEIAEIVDGKVVSERAYCILEKEDLKKQFQLLQYEKKNFNCLTMVIQNQLDDSFKKYYEDVDEYKNDCGHHKL
jgi:hypothetical protein